MVVRPRWGPGVVQPTVPDRLSTYGNLVDATASCWLATALLSVARTVSYHGPLATQPAASRAAWVAQRLPLLLRGFTAFAAMQSVQ